MALKYFIAILAAVISSQASAAFYTAQKLHDDLRSFDATQLTTTHQLDSAEAYGYVFGVHDAAEGLAVVCAGPNISGAQIMKVVSTYLDQHPESWSLPAGVEVTKALSATWPCKG